ncbi:MAG: 2-oxoacid:acceptor oxidoreductase family protein [Tepidanaerobacteraceae bacterium]|jgi:2-oxoglutarate ferredoxin oxidoreductase subunit gamma|nr:2-oxoacid:acceptor oxidoreductase family protein [Tepidanaerobacteraceae bacterium]
MRQEIIFAGFGGQGIMLMGKVLAYAAMLENKKVIFLPSYGSEMRGGTANCTVIISDDEIESPIAENPNLLVAMNRPSLQKFEMNVITGGCILINSSMIDQHTSRDDVIKKKIPANTLAAELGNEKVANMIALGSVLELTGCVSKDSIILALKKSLAPRHHDILPLNKAALEIGSERVE